MPRILGVASSLRTTPLSKAMVMLVLDATEELGAETRILDLKLTPLPLYDHDVAKEFRKTDDFRRVAELVEWADAFVLGSPDYHGSMSGTMKNFLDYFWHEFAGKLFSYVVASHEKGLTVQDQMRTVVRQCYGWSLPYGLAGSDENLEADQQTPRPELLQRAQMMAHDLVTYAPLITGQFRKDLASREPNAGFASRYRPKQ